MNGRRSVERKRIRVDAVADIETQDWVIFVAGGVLFSDGSYQAFDWKHEDAYAELLLSIEGCLWFHNGGRFDAKWLLDHAVKRQLPCRIVAAGSRIVSARIGAKLFVYDSNALTMLSLADFTKGAGVEKEKLEIPCVESCPDGGKCGGYCAISRNMPAHLFKRMMQYLEADCRSLRAALFRLQEFADRQDLDLGITVGSSAWANARRWLELPEAPLDGSEHTFARAAYFGGRVQLFRPLASSGFEADVNSMYPSRLAFCRLPVGKFIHLYGKQANHSFSEGKEGLYRAIVNVPEMHLPPLPLRSKQGTRIAYPYGEFIGTWAAPELRYAESLGVQVSVTEGIVFNSSSVVFPKWVEKLFELRAGAPDGKSGALGTFLKYYLNSLTGKLGARPDVEEVLICPDEIPLCKRVGACKDKCTGLCGAAKPLGLADDFWIVKRWRVAPCAHVEWAAYLTAEARIEWHKQAISKNDGIDMVYGDTDSVFSLEERTRNIGKELGQWEPKGAWKDFKGWAPKLYTYKKDEKRTVKAKGLRLPKDAEAAYSKLKNSEAVSASAVIGFWKGAREGKFFSKGELTRVAGEGFGDRILERGSEFTRAPNVTELDEIWAR